MKKLYTLLCFLFFVTAINANADSVKADRNHNFGPTNVDQPDNVTVCNGASTNTIVFTSTVPGTTFTWTNNNTSIGLGASGSGNIAPFTAINTGSTPVTATIIVTPTVGTAKTFTITITPIPNVNNISNSTLCNNTLASAVSLSGTIAGANYSWSHTNTSIGLASSGTGNIPSFTTMNSTNAVVTSTATVTPSFGISSKPELLYYKFNGTGANAPNLAINPPSGTTTGTFNGNMFQGGNGNCGGALQNTSTSPTNTDYFSTGWSPSLNNSSWTVSFQTSGFPTSGNVDYKVLGSPNGSSPIIVSYNPTIGFFLTYINSATGFPRSLIIDGSIGSSLKTITIVYNKNEDKMSGYVDGLLTSTLSTNGHSANIISPSFYIGGLTTGVSNTSIINGCLIDEVRFYNRAISLPEVQGLTNSCSAGGVCVGPSKIFDYIVYPDLVVNQPSSQNLCHGSNTNAINFTGTSGATFTWTNNNPSIGLAASGTGNIPSFTATNSGTSSILATIIVTPILAGGPICTASSKTFTIRVNPIPTVNAVPDQTVCRNTSITAINFTGSVTGTQYNWTNSNTTIGLAASGSSSIPAFTATNNTNAPISSTITVTPVFNFGGPCLGTPTTFVITVYPDAIVNDPSDQNLCTGTSTTAINFTGTSGATFNWTNNNPSIGLAASGTGNIPSFTTLNTANSTQVATITVTPSVSGGPGCTASAQTFTITVTPIPTVNNVANQILCNTNATSAINFSGTVSGTNYAWTNTNPSIGLPASGSGAIPSFTAINTGTSPVTGTITVTPSFGNPVCVGAPKTFDITVYPNLLVDDPADQTICAGSATTDVNFTGTAGAVYNWTNSNPSIGLAASGTGNILSFTPTFSGNAPITATIIVTPSFSGGPACAGSSQTFTITINPIPTVNNVANQAACNNVATTAINFTGNVAGATYSWTNSDPSIGLPANGSGNIPSFTATNTSGSPVTSTITVTPTFGGTNGNPVTIPLPAQTVPFSGFTRGYWFTAPTGFVMTSLLVPTDNGGDQNIAVLKFNGNTPPPVFSGITNAFTTVFITQGNTSSGAITVNIPINAGEVIGIFGTRNNISSYAASPYTTTIGGFSVPLTRMGMQANLNTTAPQNVWQETSGSLARVFFDYVIPSAACTGSPEIFSITVNPSPTVSAVANQNICTGNNTTAINFTGNVAGTTYNWTNSNPSIGLAASGTGNIASFIATNAGTTTQTATITVTPVAPGSSCPGTTESFTISVSPVPTGSASQVSQAICSESAINTVSFTGNVPGITFNWVRDNLIAITGIPTSGTGDISGVLTNTTTGFETTTFIITPSIGGCVGTPFTVLVDVEAALPTVIASSSAQTICSGANIIPVTLTSTASNTTFTWTRDNTNTVTGIPSSGSGDITGALVNTTALPITVTFTIVPTANGCPGPSSTVTVVVNPVPDAIATPATQLVCSNNAITSIILSSSVAGTTYNWTRDNTANLTGIATNGTSDIIGTLINTTNGPQTTIFTITPVSASGCLVNATTAEVVVNPRAIVNIVGNRVQCNGGTVNAINFSSTTAGGTITYDWTNSEPGIGLAANGSGNIPAFTATNTTNTPIVATIVVTPTFTNGISCAGAPQTFTITINPTPTVNAIANIAFCNAVATSPIAFSGAVAGTVYSWTNSNISIGLPSSGSGNLVSFVPTNPGTTPITATITVTPTYSNAGVSCTGASTSFVITINPSTNVATEPVNRAICFGASTVFNVTATGLSLTYQWQINPGSGYVDITGATSSTLNIVNAPSGLNTTGNRYRCVVRGLCGSDTTIGAFLTINNLPTITLNANPRVSLIPHQSTNVIATVNPTGGSFVWYYNDTLVPGISGATYNNITIDRLGSYKAVYTDLNGCVSTAVPVAIVGEPSNNLWVFPNPNKGLFNIRFYNGNKEQAVVSIYNGLGKRIVRRVITTGNTYNTTNIDIRNQAAGYYIIEVTNKSNVRLAVKKVLIQP